MTIVRRWNARTTVERLDLSTRWPLYVLSASEPLIALLVVGGQPHVRAWGAGLLLAVAVAHTIACVALLRANLSRMLGGAQPVARLVLLAVGLTAAALAAGFAAIPHYLDPSPNSFPQGVAVAALFCGALTVTFTPVLTSSQLLGLIAPQAALVAIAQAIGARGLGDQPLWAVLFVLWAVPVTVTYRSSFWYLSTAWELERSRQMQSRLAVAEERLRFARDLHDVLGRNLTLIAINSELAAQLARRGQDGAVERMLEVRQTAEDSMREVRAVVDGYRTTDLGAELSGARSVLRAAGISTRVIGDGDGLSRTAQGALGWVVREAVTNIIRHSEATSVTITLDVGQDAGTGRTAVLRIANDRARAPDASGGGGTGLAGLRERLADLGGEVSVARADGGFVVSARVPIVADDQATTAELVP
ncbi:MAG: sensor histidine kinase [Pseudonocardiales bacterium]|nr:MAG: sensor histidine kinase [Pseudonocardiales bacterium]